MESDTCSFVTGSVPYTDCLPQDPVQDSRYLILYGRRERWLRLYFIYQPKDVNSMDDWSHTIQHDYRLYLTHKMLSQLNFMR